MSSSPRTHASADVPESSLTTVTLEGDAATAAAAGFVATWAESSRYALVSELARGGGGRVAIAIDRKLGRRVALKRPLEAHGGARLEQEAYVLARLEHPSIVPIHDTGRDRDGEPFYTMKLVDGATFAERIAATTTFDERLALLSTISAVADAMAYAHAQGVIHRDLKPRNVVVGAFGEVAVIDWGLGKLVDGAPDDLGAGPALRPGLTAHASVVGTPAYMAPEQARGEVVDRRADVYAIGAMLYHALTGDPPYPKSATDETLAALRASPPPPIETREPNVPRDLAAIVGKAMAYAAADRYPTAAELAEDLRRYQTGRLVAAHHYPIWTRAWRWLRRHQGRVALASGALALAAAGAVWAITNHAVAEEPCVGLEAPVRAIWSPAVAARIAPRFAQSAGPGGLAAWRTVASALDARAAAIGDMRGAACRMARVTGEQSSATLDLRMTCLDRRTAELDHFASWLATADGAALGKAVDGVAALGRVADCADVTRLHDVAPMPAAPAKRAAIAAVESDLDALSARARDGKYVEAEQASAALIERADATGYEPLRARVRYERAQLVLLQTQTPETLALVAEALDAAERAGADRLRADVLLLQLHVELNTLQHVDVAAALASQVAAIGERVQDPTIRAAALGYQAQIALARDHVPEAIADAERAVALLPDKDGRDGWAAQSRLASIYLAAHRYADADRILTALVASRRAVIGDADDPSLANTLANLAVVADMREDKSRAATLLVQAAGMLDRTLPVDAKARLQAHTNLASLEDALGRHAEALAELVALQPVAERKLGHDHQAVADIVFRIAESRQHLHDSDGALAGYADALARYTAAHVPLWAAKCHGHMGAVLLEVDRAQAALPELAAALAATSELRGADSPEAAVWRGDVGRAKLALGDARGARPELERALVTLDHDGDPVDRGLYRLALATARWQLGDRPAARELATQARPLFESAGAEGEDGLRDCAAWDRAHPP